MRRTFFICESENRWRRIAGHAADQMLPSQDDVLILRSVADAKACSNAAAAEPASIVLWELPAQDAADMLSIIDRLNRSNQATLQLIALPAEASLSRSQRIDVELALRELGAVALLDHPFALLRISPALRRHWQRHQRSDNLAAVQQIWERLPWRSESH